MKLRDGTLETRVDDAAKDGLEENENEEEASDYTEYLQSIAENLVHSLDVDQWVAVYYNGDGYPGSVQEVLCMGFNTHFTHWFLAFIQK